jgi:hypothetical protein
VGFFTAAVVSRVSHLFSNPREKAQGNCKHTIQIPPPLSLKLLPPPPNTIINQTHTHPTPNLQLQTTFPLPLPRGTNPTPTPAIPPKLRQHLRQPTRQIIRRDTNLPNGKNRLRKQILPIIQINKLGEEGV